MINWHDPIFVWTAVGTVAGVVGVFLSLYVIRVTKGARKAARAAERAVQASARKRGLVEELENVHHKADQLGALLQHEQWFAVQMRIQEISAICSQILSRWPEGLSVEKRGNLTMAAGLARSIGTRISASEFNASERGKLVTTQLRLSDHISGALGEARKVEERTLQI
ncbi:hypothetical protein SBA7_1750008 [Candidatus Sulfotelmatobacter sp. SbA7]|nr:hypothetical protein SBA7_1750008 [Candidatus Sulfotelmatobacter sp. SbA7]